MIRSFVGFVRAIIRSRYSLGLEILAPCQQLWMLQRK
jgi:hypothetical protein